MSLLFRRTCLSDGSEMRSFLIKAGCFIAIQVVILSVVLKYGSQDATSNNYLYALKDKSDLLRTTPSPRIIFAGGSNLAFGLKSGIVKEKTGYHPINLGLHGLLGIRPLIRLMTKNLREGDVVVLSPEFAIMFRSPGCAEDLGLEMLGVWPESRELIEPDLEIDVDEHVHFDSPLEQLAAATKRTRKILTGDGPEIPEIYKRAGFNSFGDHVAHYEIDPPHFNGFPLHVFSETGLKTFAADVRDFADVCAARSCKVVLACPPVRLSEANADPDRLQQLHKLLSAHLNIQVITNTQDIVLEDRMFYDCPLHLNEQGAEIRTQRLCRCLKRFNVCRETDSSVEDIAHRSSNQASVKR